MTRIVHQQIKLATERDAPHPPSGKIAGAFGLMLMIAFAGAIPTQMSQKPIAPPSNTQLDAVLGARLQSVLGEYENRSSKLAADATVFVHLPEISAYVGPIGDWSKDAAGRRVCRQAMVTVQVLRDGKIVNRQVSGQVCLPRMQVELD